MADNPKQGPNVTDLKARLGLKKQPGGGAPAAGGAPFAPAPLPGGPQPGVVAPPGVRAPGPIGGVPSPLGNVPAPPGMAPSPMAQVGNVPPPPGFPQQAEPPAQDPRRDPYAAQQAAMAANLAAFYGAGQPLPGNADEVKTEKKKAPVATILMIVGPAVGALIVGYLFGNIAYGRKDYNMTTTQASQVRDRVEKVQKQVLQVQAALREIKLSDREAPDFKKIEKLAEIDFKEPDITTDLFHTNYYSFEMPVVQSLFNYYQDTLALSKQLADHSARTLKDKESIEKYTKANAGKQDKPLGVILDYSQALPTAQLVEMGGLVCPTPGQTDCPPAEAKFQFRTSLGGSFQTRGVKGTPQNVVFPITPTELQKQVMSGDPSLLAFRDYVRRAAALYETMKRCADDYKQLEDGLKKRANQPMMFAP